MKDFIVIGHRGACYYEPENTLRSFKKALRLKVDCVECDVRLTKDNKVIIMHDKTLDRTTNGKGLVSNFTLKELKKLDAGKKEKIPLLQEYINLAKNKAIMCIELKRCKNIVKETLKIINKNKIQDKVILLSFHTLYLRKVKKFNPKIKTGFLSIRPLLAIKRAKLCNPDFIGIYHRFINKKFIEKCHKNNFKIFVYVNVKENPPKNYLKKLINLGLDGIALNKPII